MNRRVFAIVFAATVFASCPAQAQLRPASVQTEFKELVKTYWTVWGAGDVVKASAMYAKDSGLVFYDLEPLKYVGWSEYEKGVVPNILDKFVSVKFRVNDDLKATERGGIAWTTVTVRVDGTLKATGVMSADIRHTAIWEKRGGRWLIVHEHVSVPSTLPAAP